MLEQGSMVRRDPQVRRAPTGSSGLYDVLDLILDKGIVIDAFVRVSLVGIELLTVDARVVIASVDTYLRYAEGVERLQVYNRSGSQRLGDLVGKTAKTAAVSKGVSKVKDAISGGDDDEDNEDDEDRGVVGSLTDGVRKGVGKLIGSITGGDDDDDEGDKREKEEARPKPRQEHGRQGNGSGGKAPVKAGARR
jgi:hypothetical protein